jgi:hypothetical protein
MKLNKKDWMKQNRRQEKSSEISLEIGIIQLYFVGKTKALIGEVDGLFYSMGVRIRNAARF